MKQYEIYFSLFGKHLKTTVYAESEEDAYEAIRKKIVFHKHKTKVGHDPVDYLKSVFGFK